MITTFCVLEVRSSFEAVTERPRLSVLRVAWWQPRPDLPAHARSTHELFHQDVRRMCADRTTRKHRCDLPPASCADEFKGGCVRVQGGLDAAAVARDVRELPEQVQAALAGSRQHACAEPAARRALKRPKTLQFFARSSTFITA